MWHGELIQASNVQKNNLKKTKQFIFNLDGFPDWAYSPPQQVYQHTWEAEQTKLQLLLTETNISISRIAMFLKD